MLIAELDDVSIRRITTAEETDRWRAGFIGAYQTVFSGFPYFERFYPSEAEGVFRQLTRTPEHITLVATRGQSQVVGFAAAIPLTAKPDVATHLTGLVPARHTFYLAELGVLEPWRGRQAGRSMVRERLRLIDPECYSHVVLRVSMNHTPSGEMYKAMGFEEMGVYQDVSAMRTDGKVTTDRRMFLSKLLSQVPLD
ncbi:MAG: GNAT family N-acetyltransferase [Myxococcales bacterium]|nr:GNAT family N-acetyltransferase [Myxococcales bacterium]